MIDDHPSYGKPEDIGGKEWNRKQRNTEMNPKQMLTPMNSLLT